MPTDKNSVEALMKDCQRGVPGKGSAIETANNLLAECYGTLGGLLKVIDGLRAENKRLVEDRDGLLESGAHLL
ncbi:hypothetical protein ACFW6U_10130 [Pseudomonas guariconensis]|uniref:hypothetical protein n=1 Tax=Pseudomonas TaxID=286 RepID=UPI002022486A|nr:MULTISPECIES: hypothetical protein [unclassified Pseudomonas]URD44505.1 hypothetical protein M6G63_09765 [Pseudomonas sp. BYT-5]URK99831.1 hypothetical protein J5X93_09735 [Pseudomonas sp. BYT-1]